MQQSRDVPHALGVGLQLADLELAADVAIAAVEACLMRQRVAEQHSRLATARDLRGRSDLGLMDDAASKAQAVSAITKSGSSL